MTFVSCRRLRSLALFLGLALVVVPTESAWAVKNRTIVLRATGSGALLGLGAGIVSYPFAKSTGTIIAGVAVGALLGTVYGFYLVDRREEALRANSFADFQRAATLDVFPGAATLDDLFVANEARNAVLRRGTKLSQDFVFPVTRFEF